MMIRAVGLFAIVCLPLLAQSPSAGFEAAVRLFNSGKYQDCFEALSSYIAGHPADGGAYKIMGMAEFMLGRSEQARSDLIRATELSPQDSEAYYYLARLYFSSDNPVASLQALQKALVLNPGSVKAENQMGQSLEALGRQTEAEAAYRKAIDLQSGLPHQSEWPYYNLGLLCAHEGRAEESILFFHQALECNPNLTLAKIKLAVALSAKQHLDEARKLLEDAVDSEPGNAEAHYRLAIILKKSGDPSGSQQQFALFEKYRKP